MDFEWDDHKSAVNFERHQISFEAVFSFNWQRALITDRTRHADGEVRFAAIGHMGDECYTIIYTIREDRRRIISMRRANKPEERAYEEYYR